MAARDKDAWLAVFADDAIVEDPIGPSHFDPEGKGPGSDEFYVITGRVRLFSTFGAVSSIALADQGGAAA